MKTIRMGLFGLMSAAVLFGFSGGLLHPRTVSAQTATEHLISVPAMPVLSGQYCKDATDGEIFVTAGSSSEGLYCGAANPPAFTAPAVDPNWVAPIPLGVTE